MDVIVPGGVARDLAQEGIGQVEALLAEVRRVFPRLIELYDNTASLQDRTVTTGIVKPALARQFGAGGYVGRAPAAPSMRAACSLMRLTTSCHSKCRCSMPATSMRGSGSAFAKSSRACR